jgi:hypothetical protein
VLAALDSWEAQTSRSEFELIVLCPTAPSQELPRGQRCLEIGGLLLHEARAAGVYAAEAEFILLAEDHCLPDPGCAAAILVRIDEKKWDAIGPALRSGDPRSAVAQGAFMISYSQWLLPESGQAAHLPGHNAALRKSLLVAEAEHLEDQLIAPLFFMQKLNSEGRKFCVDGKARMRHFDTSDWSKSVEIFFTVGKACGGIRLNEASLLRRLLYAVLTPVTAARHFARGLIHYVRAGHGAGFGLVCLVPGAFLACVWACGETVGAWRGIGRVLPSLWVSEIKPVTREQAELSRAVQQLD